MTLKQLVCLILLALTAQSAWPAFAEDAIVCPAPPDNNSYPETGEDCPWAGLSRLLVRASHDEVSLVDVLEKNAPRFLSDLRSDADQEDLKRLWGKSINYDELAKGTIVHPAILDLLAQQLRVPAAENRIVHAGMEHTYGYLFSLLKTSFGYKRARWVQSDIARGFGLPRDALGPEPREGTLFSNVTYFIGRIALEAASGQLAVRNAENRVHPALRDFDFSAVHFSRLEETIEIPTLAEPRRVVLRTDLVPFFHAPETEGANTQLLIYSVFDSAVGDSRLITAFPVATSFSEMVLNPENLGEQKPIITRYNGYIAEITGKTWLGTRTVRSN